jgi:drug/metabolite transporter, DME family
VDEMQGQINGAVARRRGLTFVAGAAALWGTSGLTATVAYGRGVDPLTVSAWRMALGVLALSVMLGVRSRRDADVEVVALRALGRAERWRLVVVAIALAAYQACYFVAVGRAGVTIATLVTLGSAPLLVAVGERFFDRRRTGWWTTAGIGMALAGLVALVGTPAAAGPQVMLGAVLAVGSAFGYSVVTLVGGRLGTRLGGQRMTIAAFAGAAGLLVPLAAATAGLGIGRDVVVFGALLYLGVLPTAVAYWLYFTGLPAVRATQAAVLVLLEPLVAAGLAVLLLGERLTLLGWAGAGLLVVAVTLVARSRE